MRPVQLFSCPTCTDQTPYIKAPQWRKFKLRLLIWKYAYKLFSDAQKITSLIHFRKQEKYAKANCMTTQAQFLKTWRQLDFKQCAEKKQYQQILDARNFCWVHRFSTCCRFILNYDLVSLPLLSKYNWLLTNHADVALEVSHKKLTNMFLAFSYKLIIKVFNQILHT